LVYSDLKVACSIEDDGVGFDQETRQKGFGLLSMQDRAAALGGDFILQSDQGEGTTVAVTIPLVRVAADIQEESDG
jgi:signal transduction histidine kinase